MQGADQLALLSRQAFSEGVGWLSIAYTPEDGKRQSASVAYVHPSELSWLSYLPYHLSLDVRMAPFSTEPPLSALLLFLEPQVNQITLLTVMGKRKNLHLYLETWVNKLELSADGKTVVGVRMTSKDGNEFVLKAKHEVLLAAGAVDTPRLMLLSGIGPKKDLEELGIESRVNLRGVGENLVDHPESIIMWEVDELPPQTVMQSDTA